MDLGLREKEICVTEKERVSAYDGVLKCERE